MARVKQTSKLLKKHAHSVLKKTKAAVKQVTKGGGGAVVHTGKLKVPFKPASANGIGKIKKGLVKLIKRRWRSGTVAKREIRKLSRTTHHLFPKRPFQRLVRELAGDIKSDIRFAKESMHAIQECAEFFVCSMFMKSDIARNFAGRKTLLPKDVKFATFMRDESIWQFPPSRGASGSAPSIATKALPAPMAPLSTASKSKKATLHTNDPKKKSMAVTAKSGTGAETAPTGDQNSADNKKQEGVSAGTGDVGAPSAVSNKGGDAREQPKSSSSSAPKEKKRKSETAATEASSGEAVKKTKRDKTPSDSESSESPSSSSENDEEQESEDEGQQNDGNGKKNVAKDEVKNKDS